MSGKKQPELHTTLVLPECCYDAWTWFLRLHMKRSSNGFGVNPISSLEMWSFFQMEGIEPETWEIHLIEELDKIALDSISKQNEKNNDKK